MNILWRYRCNRLEPCDLGDFEVAHCFVWCGKNHADSQHGSLPFPISKPHGYYYINTETFRSSDNSQFRTVMAFLIGRGVPSIIFAILFTALLIGCLWCVKSWGRRSGFLKLGIFCAIRVGAAICGIIVAADNFSNVNVIIAESVLTQVGSFMIYYAIVGFYQASAKYYDFWQGDTAKLVYTFQRLTLYVLIALAIASGVEGSNYDNPSSVALAMKLAQAYSIIYISFLTINAVQWGALWFSGRMGNDSFSICCSLALFFVYLKAIYLVASAWVTDISVRNPFVNTGWYVGCAFAPDFLGAFLCVLGGFIAPQSRKEAGRAFATEQHLQEQGARYDNGGSANDQSKWYTRGQMSYKR